MFWCISANTSADKKIAPTLPTLRFKPLKITPRKMSSSTNAGMMPKRRMLRRYYQKLSSGIGDFVALSPNIEKSSPKHPSIKP